MPPTPRDSLTQADIADIRASGRDPDRVELQWAALRETRQPTPVLRPATLGDGISRLEDHDRADLRRRHEEACQAGRVSSFVPASGSGTRMFRSLLQLHRDQETDLDGVRLRASRGDADAKDALVVLENIGRFAVWPALEARGCSPQSVGQVLDCLFGPGGLPYHEWPKGLIPFHVYDDGVRSAFAEHLYEAAHMVADGRPAEHGHVARHCDAHFTIGEPHRESFERARDAEVARIEHAVGVRCRVAFSAQLPATDTIATDHRGTIRRDEAGHIAFHPGGHGALLDNLGRLSGDVVLIKNIDNIARRDITERIVDVRRMISGLLLRLEDQVHVALRHLRTGGDARAAINVLDGTFGIRSSVPLLDDESRRRYAEFQLDRPIRVCGVVSALDHAGGRPFWVDTPDRGPTLQIVEGAEINLTDSGSRELFHRSHHFNPVDIACSLRDANGDPFDLDRFAVRDRALIASKVLAGTPSRIYEHPGLWNGAMGLWNTAFVEVPDFTFNPVKSLADLWAPGHRP
ncbi:MAG: DUF4301 family protein [Acidobacteria bacterium]|nr:DUF4301 family protein [Acidobacteriota bacterium]